MTKATLAMAELSKFQIGKWVLLGMVLWLPVLSGQAAGLADDPEGAALLQEAQRMVAAYHAGQPPATNRLRVVYFVPKDGAPLSNYTERLDRVMTDVSDFYRDGFRRLGIKSDGLPLERENGRLLIHLVRGKLPADQYHHESGDETAQEIHDALKGSFDIEREHTLVFYALCRRTNDGRYIFTAPYYGGGSAQAGLCHAADCELLDPLLLHETKRKIVYTEHYYPRMEQTLAAFNSFYLGGVAHELGHALGLPHDNGNVDEKRFGTSLMGEGNLTYRQEEWGGGAPTYLARASILRLLSQPLFTGSNRGRWEPVKPFCDSLNFSVTNGVVWIEGAITDAIPAYAMVAYVWGEKSDDHRALTFPAVVRSGRFVLGLNGMKETQGRRFQLMLSKIHVNGASAGEEFMLNYDGKSRPDVSALNTEWVVDRAENAVIDGGPAARDLVSDAAIAVAPTPDAAGKLRALLGVLEPPAPLDLQAVTGASAFLSDVTWTDAKVGWGQVARNHFWFDAGNHGQVLLRLDGRFFEKGLYAHSPARYAFSLDGRWKWFRAVAGLQDGAADMGSAVFTVRGDGRELYRSKILRAGELAQVKVDVKQVKDLELLTAGGEGHNHFSWAIWADPRVER